MINITIKIIIKIFFINTPYSIIKFNTKTIKIIDILVKEKVITQLLLNN